MSLDKPVFIGLAIGVLSFVTLYIGKGLQKYAIEGVKTKKSLKNKHSAIWVLGTALAFAFMFVHWAALKFAPVNLIAPLEGTGLVTLMVFSHYVLEESISRVEIMGVVLIIGGTALASLFNTNTAGIATTHFSMTAFLGVCGPLVVIGIIPVSMSKANGYKYAGFSIGFSAGSMMALQTLTKRLSFIEDLTLVFSPLALMFGTATLAITQFAFTKAQANQVVPCFTSASIIIATLAGRLVLRETLVSMQVVGIVTILTGVVMLTAFHQSTQRENSTS